MKILKKILILMIIFLASYTHASIDLYFKKVIIWGHKLHSHTHSYIHEAFYKAFQAMGYDTFWFDNNDNISDFNFENCLFVTEGQADRGIPLVFSSYYLLHNVDQTKYKALYDNAHAITFQVYTHRCVGQHADIKRIDKCIYASKTAKTIYMPWGADLLPDQIDAIKEKVKKKWGKPKEKTIYWIGTIGGGLHGNINQINTFKNACEKKAITFKPLMRISAKENSNLIFNSYMAPTIVGEWQADEGYIPCRIFKNISYGQFGITNSKAVYDLFDHKIVYNSNTEQLFIDAQARLKDLTLQEMLDLMDLVKEKHTYINRINLLLNFLLECAREN
ncbi:MAG: hypothetical protein K2X90_02665 [Candidatus Babeliaceae bacterium]|nr:hypothetical protein [Candidatus Babeliaceae bacterium]